MAENTWHIQRYTPADKVRWNCFVAEARNAVFMFDRRYMDYHSDRFSDHSLLAFRGGHLAGVLPADMRDGVLRSHGGLTYGGWILPRTRIDGSEVLGLFGAWLEYCRAAGVREIIYNPVPYIYHLYPSQEDLYALWRYGAVRRSSLLSSAVSYAHRRPFSVARRRQVRRAVEASGPIVAESRDFCSFWPLLEECLADRHQACPVHSAGEMERLAGEFPAHIRLFTIADQEGVQGGVVIYDTGVTAHCQYIASTSRGRSGNLLPVLFDYLLGAFEPGHSYFDFGTSNEDGGKWLNSGLLNQKYTLGGTGVAYDSYHLQL